MAGEDMRLKWCKQCGCSFETKTVAAYCSPDCKHERRKETASTVEARHVILSRVLDEERVPKSDPLWLLSEYEKLVSQDKCHYCEGPLGVGIGLDRKQNSKNGRKLPHSFENCVPCCRRCNSIKGDDTILT